jgi:hypothetical protein
VCRRRKTPTDTGGQFPCLRVPFSLHAEFANSMLGLLFGTEDEVNIFLRNNGLFPNYTVLHREEI